MEERKRGWSRDGSSFGGFLSGGGSRGKEGRGVAFCPPFFSSTRRGWKEAIELTKIAGGRKEK